MAETEKDWTNFLKGFVIGSFLGALAGVLFAPKSGAELRSDLKEKGSEVLKEVKEVYTEAGAKAKAILDEAKLKADELRRQAEHHLTEARQKAREILAGEEKGEGDAGEGMKEMSGAKEV